MSKKARGTIPNNNDRIFRSASMLIHSSTGQLTTANAMKLCGMSEEEAANLNLRKQVQRMQKKIMVLKKNKKCYCQPMLSQNQPFEAPPNHLQAPTASAVELHTAQKEKATTVTASAMKKKLNGINVRMTSRQAQAIRKKKIAQRQAYCNAVKLGSAQLQQELENKRNAKKRGVPYKMKSANAIADNIKAEKGVEVSSKTLRNYVNAGKAGVTPLKRGTKGSIPPRAYKALCGAFESYVKLSAVDGDVDITRPTLTKLVNTCINKMPDEN